MPSKTEQLFLAVKQQILDGNYVKGSKFPAGRDFAAHYNVSYLTANNVLKMLENEGLPPIKAPGVVMRQILLHRETKRKQ